MPTSPPRDDTPSPDDHTPPSDDAAAGRPRRLSRRARRVLRDLHQRTWELEFLMSGALAVALGQLPGRIDEWYNRTFPLMGEVSGLLATLGYQYVKLIVYTLILTFVVHIGLRAFWVSLIGLDSVFPRGVRWNRTRHGPISTAYLRRHLPSVRELIVRTDGIASVIFAAAFQLVAAFVVSIVIVAVVTGPILVLGHFGIPLPAPGPLLATTAIVLAAMLALPPAIDRLRGDRIDPNGWAARWIRLSHAVNLRVLGLAVYGPTQQTLASQMGGRRVGVLVAVVVLGISTTFIVRDVLIQQERLQFGPLTFVPAIPGAAGVDPRYYESQWLDGPPSLPVPSIPHDALDDETAWVRLFVPFRATADPEAMAVLCPALEPLSRTGLRVVRPERGLPTDTLGPRIQESLDCAQRLWEVTLDEGELPSDAVFATHPVTGLPGLSWYIEVRDLAAGRHLLTVRRSDAAHAADLLDADEDDPPTRHHHEIPFWR